MPIHRAAASLQILSAIFWFVAFGEKYGGRLRMRKLGSTLLPAFVLGAAFCWLVSESANAGLPQVPGGFFANIDDTTEVMLGSLNDTGYIAPTNPFAVGGLYVGQPGLSINMIQEGVAQLGVVAIHAEYRDTSPLPIGAVAIVNFNVFEAGAPTLISDNLSITFTGHLITVNDPTNMSVDFQFLSGSSDEAKNPNQFPAGPNTFSVAENTDVTDIIFRQTGLVNFQVKFASDVPEPSTFVMLGLGMASLVGYRLRKRFA